MAKKRFTQTFVHYLKNPHYFNQFRRLIRHHGHDLEITHVGWENGSRDIYVRLNNGTTIDHLSPNGLMIFEVLEETEGNE